MEGILGKAFAVIGIHILGFMAFYAIWFLIVIPKFGMPAMTVRDLATLYLLLDVLYFIMAKFDN